MTSVRSNISHGLNHKPEVKQKLGSWGGCLGGRGISCLYSCEYETSTDYVAIQYVGGTIPMFCQFTTTASAYYGDQKSFRDNNLVSSDRSSFLYYSKSLSQIRQFPGDSALGQCAYIVIKRSQYSNQRVLIHIQRQSLVWR